MGKIVKTASLGLIKDPFGTDKAAKRAMDAERASMEMQKEMFDKSQAFQREMWDWQKGQAAPWTEAGLGALGQYQGMLTGQFDPTTDPMYQARLEEQSKAFGAGGASRGMQLSGGTLKGLRDITASEIGSAYDRRMASLANLMSMGAGASTGLAGLGSQFAGQQQQAMQQFGAGQAMGLQNIGAIGAQQATAPFQNLMSLGSIGAGLMSGAGAMGFKPFSGGGSLQQPMAMNINPYRQYTAGIA